MSATACPHCHADVAEIIVRGHRREADGLGGSRACPEACGCVPEHVTRAEHREYMAREDVEKVLLKK